MINKFTNTNNQAVLKEVLALLKETNKKDELHFNLNKNFEAIKDVLQKLLKGFY